MHRLNDLRTMTGNDPISGKKVFVAGHNGMVGSAIMRKLEPEDCDVVTASHDELDLTCQSEVSAWFASHQPDTAFLAAARVGGIIANNDYPVDFLLQNLQIQTNIIQSAFESGAGKLVFLGSSCIYPKFATQPIKENALLTDALEPTNEWYAIAKITGIKLCQAYQRQHGADFISAMPCNLYGINDNFDLESSHVVPALMRKAHEAKLNNTKLTVWGTGSPRREFLFADDAADGVVYLARNYTGYEHVNVGSGKDFQIREIVDLICTTVGFEGEIEYDTSRPDGTPRKLMDNGKIRGLGWTPSVDFETGLKTMYAWYRDHG